jgi:hypothetical protein
MVSGKSDFLTSLELGNTSFVTRVHRFVGSTFMVHADDFNRILQFLPIVPWAEPWPKVGCTSPRALNSPLESIGYGPKGKSNIINLESWVDCGELSPNGLISCWQIIMIQPDHYSILH